MTLGILFDVNRADLRPGSGEVIDTVADMLEANPDLGIEVQGHTDSTGTADRNRQLSLERARAVAAALGLYGVEAKRLVPRRFGQDQPVADNAIEEGRQQMGHRGALTLVAATAVLAACCSGSSGGGTTSTTPTAPSLVTNPGTGAIPTGLALPVAPEAINLRGVINPFGVVRFSGDRAEVGHPGIDIPVNQGTALVAVGDGQIVSIDAATDGLPGDAVKVLLSRGPSEGTGWVFLYEHVNVSGGLGVGSQVSRGQVIATSATSAAFTNHLELSDTFNGYRFHRDQTCWIPQLAAGDRARFQSYFDSVLRTDSRFISAWQTVSREGQLPFSALLNTEKYPDGARLCYPRGTDERVPAPL